jgi:hypothetical protein
MTSGELALQWNSVVRLMKSLGEKLCGVDRSLQVDAVLGWQRVVVKPRLFARY